MKILTTKDFNIEAVTQQDDDSPSITSQIYLGNSATNVFIDGVILELCLSWNNYYVLFTTDDIPYEESLHIYLLSKTLVILDSLTLSAIYSTGTFKLIELIEPNEISFLFFDQAKWKIVISHESELHIPFFSDPKGVHRKIAFSRYLTISNSPLPKSS